MKNKAPTPTRWCRTKRVSCPSQPLSIDLMPGYGTNCYNSPSCCWVHFAPEQHSMNWIGWVEQCVCYKGLIMSARTVNYSQAKRCRCCRYSINKTPISACYWLYFHLALMVSMDSDMMNWPGPWGGELVCLSLSQKNFTHWTPWNFCCRRSYWVCICKPSSWWSNIHSRNCISFSK